MRKLRLKLLAALNILRGRPTMYRITFDDGELRAVFNKNAFVAECNFVTLNATGFQDRIRIDGRVVHDPNGGDSKSHKGAK